jgi:hypothetical protein
MQGLLVNNAGVHGRIGSFAQSEVGDWWRTLEVNPARPPHAAWNDRTPPRPGHQYREWGRREELPHFSTHVTSKTAPIPYSECLAVEVKYYSIAHPSDGAAHRAHRHGGIFAELARRENLAALVSSDLRRGPRFAHGAAARVDVGPRVWRNRRAFWVLHPAAIFE